MCKKDQRCVKLAQKYHNEFLEIGQAFETVEIHFLLLSSPCANPVGVLRRCDIHALISFCGIDICTIGNWYFCDIVAFDICAIGISELYLENCVLRLKFESLDLYPRKKHGSEKCKKKALPYSGKRQKINWQYFNANKLRFVIIRRIKHFLVNYILS